MSTYVGVLYGVKMMMVLAVCGGEVAVIMMVIVVTDGGGEVTVVMMVTVVTVMTVVR